MVFCSVTVMGRGWKYHDGDLCRRDGSATRARTMWTPDLGQHAGMARGVLETAARARTAWTADLGKSPGRAEVSPRWHGHGGEDGADTRGQDGRQAGRGFLKTAQPPGRGRWGKGRFVVWWRRRSRTYCFLRRRMHCSIPCGGSIVGLSSSCAGAVCRQNIFS
ncbi:hypothetical protein CFC21_016158 [Triticum aestivum]|uniref:Uncharacterized protein n=2 Tax=Triticum aestivum TaxID=4565 RepID=A0A3B6AUV3_WHEAT|nr:hypothetical protein CFC21_016158 [Triticum aestivum]